MADEKLLSYRASTADLYFGRECLNRVSFLREDSVFMRLAATHSSAKLMVMVGGNPVTFNTIEDDNFLTLDQNSTTEAYMNQWLDDVESRSPAARAEGKPIIVFLGLRDQSVGFDGKGSHVEYKDAYFGVPYFAMSFPLRAGLEAFTQKLGISTYTVRSQLADAFTLSSFNAGLFSHARMYVDWIAKTRFCGGCGSPVVPINGGSKLKCLNDKKTELDVSECPVQLVSVSNLLFPRTDCVAITAVVTSDLKQILLGTSKRWKGNKDFDRMWSCIAGFMEPLETVEVAAKRECWEETGVVVSSVRILHTQPWPFPVNLMVGCISTVDVNGVNETIHLGHDAELLDAKWFDVGEIRKMIESKGEYNPYRIVLPKRESIAFDLIRSVAFGEAKL